MTENERGRERYTYILKKGHTSHTERKRKENEYSLKTDPLQFHASSVQLWQLSAINEFSLADDAKLSSEKRLQQTMN